MKITKKTIEWGMGILFLISFLILLFYVIPQISDSDKKVKEIEVGEGLIIGTSNANMELCKSGCVKYKGEFVPKNTLEYLQGLCEENNKTTK